MSHKNIYEFSAKTNSGKEKQLSDYKGKVILIVNTASKCGFTKQYEGLQKIYDKYKKQGFEILAFPCNQFNNQEPGSNDEISNFCKTNYGVTFQLFDKIKVNGKEAHPLFTYLSNVLPGILNMKFIKWNFTKFLVDQNGVPVKRYSPSTAPEKLEMDIQRLLAGSKV